MRLLLAAAATLSLAGCQTFLGTGTPCEKAALVHVGFVTAVAVTPKIPQSAVKAESTAYAAVSAACAKGSDLKNINLEQLVVAYVAAVEEYKR